MKVKELKITSGSASVESPTRAGTVPRRRPFKVGDITEDFYVSNYEYVVLDDILNMLKNFGIVSADPFISKRFKEIENYLFQFVDPPKPVDCNCGDSVVVTFFD